MEDDYRDLGLLNLESNALMKSSDTEGGCNRDGYNLDPPKSILASSLCLRIIIGLTAAHPHCISQPLCR